LSDANSESSGHTIKANLRRRGDAKPTDLESQMAGLPNAIEAVVPKLKQSAFFFEFPYWFRGVPAS
jgi:hypothetical protein